MNNLSTIKLMFKCPLEDKKNFKTSSCSVTISMGQKKQEGIRLGATIKEINKHFKTCSIMVCDSLQRHNLIADSTESIDILHQRANTLGDNWLQANKKYFELFTIPHKIIRWDYWLCHKYYLEKKHLINLAFSSDIEFKEAFFVAATAYVNRLIKNDYIQNTCNNDIMIHGAIEYLKEECSVMLLWGDEGYNFEIYPSKRNAAMAATYTHFIKPQSPNILKPIFLEFRTRKISSNDMNSTLHPSE